MHGFINDFLAFAGLHSCDCESENYLDRTAQA